MKILYHDDMDGMVSAALLTAHLINENFFDRHAPTFASVDYNTTCDEDWKRRWPEITGGDLFAVVDFRYHPSTLFWADHHPTAFPTPQDELHFRSRRVEHPERYMWEPAPSCAQLLADKLPKLERYQEIVAGANLIDQAQYPSVEAFFEAAHPAIALSIAHRGLSEGQKTEVIRRMITSASLGAAVLAVQDQVVGAVDRERKLRDQAAPHMTYVGNTVVVDVIDQGLPFVRFAPYYYFPQAQYALTLYRSGPDIRLGLGKNPWISFNNKDLGVMARRVGGGGHSYAAGALFSADKYPAPEGAARAFVHQVAQELREEQAEAA